MRQTTHKHDPLSILIPPVNSFWWYQLKTGEKVLVKILKNVRPGESGHSIAVIVTDGRHGSISHSKLLYQENKKGQFLRSILRGKHKGSQKMKFKIGEFWWTKDGRLMMIRDINGPEPFSIIGTLCGGQKLFSWLKDGRFYEHTETVANSTTIAEFRALELTTKETDSRIILKEYLKNKSELEKDK